MSMNLYLSFTDKHEREVYFVDLVQTPTLDTYWILGLSSERRKYPKWEQKPKKLEHEVIKQRYFDWLDEEGAKNGWLATTIKFQKQKVEDAYKYMANDYTPNWSYV